jgi:hypothetical protein
MAKVQRMIHPDEGITSPYIARLWFGISELRDAILPTLETRRQFDDRYEPIVTALDKTRETAREIRALVADHRRAVRQPGAVEVYPGQIKVHVPVNETLDRRFDSFTVFAHRAMKLTQYLVKDIGGVEIGFLFQTPPNFKQSYEALQSSHGDLAAYLRAVRQQVTESLADLRNTFEHTGWSMPGMQYRQHEGEFQVGEANIGDVAFTVYVDSVLNGAMRFVEDMAAYALRTRLETPRAIIELPDVQRASLLPKRFAIAMQGDYRTWRLTWAYDSTDFLWKG